MKKSLYLFSHGILSREDNTLLYVNKDLKSGLPIAQIQDIHAYGKVTVKSGAVALLAEKEIPVHFYNKFLVHVASLLPRSGNTNGTIIVAQTKAYLNPESRAKIAREIVLATKNNILVNLETYLNRGIDDLENIIAAIEDTRIPRTRVQAIMAAEAQIWKQYYTGFDLICPNLPLEKRTFHPPHNEMNALISFLNMLSYTTTLTQILQTYLHPSISYLHEPLERRYSLALDLAEHFKPVIAHRIIFRLVNRKQIKKDSFTREEGIRLKDNALKLILTEYQKQLDTTIQVPRLKRKSSYRNIIKMDAHKLAKFLMGSRQLKFFYAK